METYQEYSAFGERIWQEGASSRLGYNSQMGDELTGLTYLRARYYKPEIGRFTQEDVIYDDGFNLYAYCDSNPVIYCDPSGFIKRNEIDNMAQCHKEGGERDNDPVYKPSPKHDPTSGWGSPNPIPDVSTGQELLDGAYSSSKNKQLYSIYDGQLVKFQPDTVEGWHSYLVSNPAKEVPTDVLRKMLNDGKITKAEYKNFIKNK